MNPNPNPSAGSVPTNPNSANLANSAPPPTPPSTPPTLRFTPKGMKHDDYIEMMNDMEQIIVNLHLPKQFVIEEGARHAVAYSVARGRTETPELWDKARIIVTKVYDTYLESVKRCGAEGCDNPLRRGKVTTFELKGGDKVVVCNACCGRTRRENDGKSVEELKGQLDVIIRKGRGSC